MNQNSTLVKDSVKVTILSIFSRGVGFLVPITIAMIFGASNTTDAFNLANTIPTFLINIFVIAIGASLVPYLINKWVNEPEEVDVVLGNIILFLGLISAIIIILLSIGIPISKSAFSTRMQINDVDLFINLSLSLLPMITLSMLVGITSAILNARKFYTFPALAPGIRAIFILISTVILGKWIGIYAVVVGYLVGEFVTFICLFYILLKVGIRPVFKQPEFKSIFQILGSIIPLLLAMIATQFNTVIARYMAGPLGDGALSILDYAERVVLIPTTLISTGVMVVLLTHWSTMVAESKIIELKHSIERSLTTILFISLPMALLLYIFRLPLVKVIFERGEFDNEDTFITAVVMGIIALGITPNLLGLIFTRVHLAFQNTKLFFVVSIIRLVITYTIIRITTPIYGISGIAIALVSSYLVTIPLLWIYSIPKVGNVINGSTLRQIMKILIANGFLLFTGQILIYWTNLYGLPEIIIVSLISIVAYFGVSIILNIPESQLIKEYSQNFIQRNS